MIWVFLASLVFSLFFLLFRSPVLASASYYDEDFGSYDLGPLYLNPDWSGSQTGTVTDVQYYSSGRSVARTDGWSSSPIIRSSFLGSDRSDQSVLSFYKRFGVQSPYQLKFAYFISPQGSGNDVDINFFMAEISDPGLPDFPVLGSGEVAFYLGNSSGNDSFVISYDSIADSWVGFLIEERLRDEDNYYEYRVVSSFWTSDWLKGSYPHFDTDILSHSWYLSNGWGSYDRTYIDTISYSSPSSSGPFFPNPVDLPSIDCGNDFEVFALDYPLALWKNRVQLGGHVCLGPYSRDDYSFLADSFIGFQIRDKAVPGTLYSENIRRKYTPPTFYSFSFTDDVLPIPSGFFQEGKTYEYRAWASAQDFSRDEFGAFVFIDGWNRIDSDWEEFTITAGMESYFPDLADDFQPEGKIQEFIWSQWTKFKSKFPFSWAFGLIDSVKAGLSLSGSDHSFPSFSIPTMSFGGSVTSIIPVFSLDLIEGSLGESTIGFLRGFSVVFLWSVCAFWVLRRVQSFIQSKMT